jgi:hypothetical protein
MKSVPPIQSEFSLHVSENKRENSPAIVSKRKKAISLRLKRNSRVRDQEGLARPLYLRPSILNEVPQVLFSSLVALGMAIALHLHSDFWLHELGAAFPVVLWGMPILILLGSVLLFFYRRYNVQYQILENGVTALSGFLSLTQIEAKLDYRQIRGTEIHRTVFDRLVGIGDLHVCGATSSGIAISLRGIRDPYYYQHIIQQRLSHVSKPSAVALQ